jgi:3-oxoacyl-[acyl-carrier protein] reductase
MVLEKRSPAADRGLPDRAALVTGGSRGIGAAIAVALAQAGVKVALNYHRNEEAALDLCRRIQEQGGHAMPAPADVTDPEAAAGVVAHVSARFQQPVDILVNCASTPLVERAFQELEWEEIEALLAVQVRAAFHCCRAALPGMLAQKSGRIINLGSTVTHGMPPAHWTAFNMAKSALQALTRSLAVEFGPQGIRVNMVSPGMTETESISAIPERLRKVQAMQTPLRRLAAPEDVARAVLFLCSEGGDFITGADLPVCGGFSI